MHNFRKLNIWIDSVELSVVVLNTTKNFPSIHKFDLGSQINRSAVSIPSNIAEGSGRTSNKEFARFIDIAIASAFELETQIIIATKIELISENQSDQIINILIRLQKMIKKFKNNL